MSKTTANYGRPFRAYLSQAPTHPPPRRSRTAGTIHIDFDFSRRTWIHLNNSLGYKYEFFSTVLGPPLRKPYFCSRTPKCSTFQPSATLLTDIEVHRLHRQSQERPSLPRAALLRTIRQRVSILSQAICSQDLRSSSILEYIHKLPILDISGHRTPAAVKSAIWRRNRIR